MDELTPLIPEEKLTRMIEEKLKELNISQRELEKDLQIDQSLISRALKNKRGFRYEEAQRIIQYLFGRTTLISLDKTAMDLATTGEKLVWIYSDATLQEAAKKMLDGGYSQIPVKDRFNNQWSGIITDLSVTKALVNSLTGRERGGSPIELGGQKVGESGLVEAMTDLPPNTPLSIAAQLLVHFYAVLLRDDLGNLKGIITRSDLLNLLNDPTTTNKLPPT